MMERFHSNRGMRVLIVLMCALLVALSGYCADTKPSSKEPGKVTGTVLETASAGSYTYIRVDTGKEKLWAAAPHFEVKVGDKVSFSEGMPMKNFESKALKRKFELVYFVEKIDGPASQPGSRPPQAPAAAMPNDDVHAPIRQGGLKKSQPAVLDFSGLKKPDGGLTVAEIYQQKDKLQGKEVTVRGKVVKYNPQIMNRNWVHVQDGTGGAGGNDLTVTSDDAAQIGDTVLIKGTLVLNKDFGAGYKYGVLVEKARVRVEQKAKQ